MASAVGSYIGDSLRVFALPVTTISAASNREINLASGAAILVLLTVVAGILRLIISYAPGGISAPLTLDQIVLQSISYFLFFVLSFLVLYALVVVFGGTTNIVKLFAAKLSLASAIVGAFALALFAKLLIGFLYLGVQDGFGGGLMLLGERFSTLALGIILAVYTLIVARFGGQLSWLMAVIVGVIHFGLMVAIITVYQVIILQNQFRALEPLLAS